MDEGPGKVGGPCEGRARHMEAEDFRGASAVMKAKPIT
jgi:hypothetical protein